MSAFLRDDKLSLKGPDGKVNPFPINWFWLKQIILISFLILMSWKPSSRITVSKSDLFTLFKNLNLSSQMAKFLKLFLIRLY